MSDAVTTPATTARSVRAATERLATYEQAPGVYLVDNGKHGEDHEQYTVDPTLPACQCPDWEHRSDELGEDGCKHIRRVRMERGEIDVTALLETTLDLDPLLLEAINAGAATNGSALQGPALATDGGQDIPEHLTRMSTIQGETIYHCQDCGVEGDSPESVHHHEQCPALSGREDD